MSGKVENVTTVPQVKDDFQLKYHQGTSLRDFSSFFAMLGLFQASPNIIKQKIYDDGNWHDAGDGILVASMDACRAGDAFFRFAFTSGITTDAPRSTEIGRASCRERV